MVTCLTEVGIRSPSVDDLSPRSASSKYRYLRPWTPRAWEFRDCFVPEATGDYNGLVFADRGGAGRPCEENLGEGLLTMHQVHHPEITVEGDGARARWYLQDKVIVPAFSFMLEGAAFLRRPLRPHR